MTLYWCPSASRSIVLVVVGRAKTCITYSLFALSLRAGDYSNICNVLSKCLYLFCREKNILPDSLYRVPEGMSDVEHGNPVRWWHGRELLHQLPCCCRSDQADSPNTKHAAGWTRHPNEAVPVCLTPQYRWKVYLYWPKVSLLSNFTTIIG